MPPENEDNLTHRHQAKFDEMCDHIEATGKPRLDAEALANALIESFDDAPFLKKTLATNHALTKLVAEYQELSEQILDCLAEKHFGPHRDLIEDE